MDNIIKVKVNGIDYGIASGGSEEKTLLADNWSQNLDPEIGGFTQEILVEGIDKNTSCVLDINVTTTRNIDAMYEQWSKIFNAVTANADGDNGKIIFYAKEKPTIDLNINIKW